MESYMAQFIFFLHLYFPHVQKKSFLIHPNMYILQDKMSSSHQVNTKTGEYIHMTDYVHK